MPDNFNTATGGNADPAQGNKTFTQDDVNRIVQERLAKEKSKSEAAIAQREQELSQRELLLSAKEKLTAKGLPLELLDALNMSSPEALDKSLTILENIKPTDQTQTLQGMKFKGVSPGQGNLRDHHDGGPDTDVRKAMGLVR